MTTLSDLLGGRYRLTELLGQGGMSDVYRATDERTGLTVAVKVVRSGDPEFARRLAQEARALERLEHPGLVRLLDTGVSGAQAYLVMEFVEGSTLARILGRGPLSPTETARIGVALAGALSYAHARGIVHRDVKPANILVKADGEARLGDFGVARLVDASTMTMAGTTLGTAAYMAPEQLEDHQVGPGADIWSLGIVLLECLTGRRVYDGTPSEVVARRLAGPVAIAPDLPVPWKLLVSGMLDHSPDQRLDGAEVAALLASPVFATAWVPAPAGTNGQGPPSVPSDLTALAPVAASVATRVHGAGDTRTAAFAASPQPPPTHGRRSPWAALSVIVIIGLAVGLVLALRSSPTAHGTAAKTGARSHVTTTTAPPTTTTTSTTTTSTTTTIPTATSALATLTSDVISAVHGGALDSVTAAAITGSAGRALVDAQAGRTRQADTQLQQAATDVTNGVQSGSISQEEGAALQTDISTLGSALGVSQSTTVPFNSPTGPAGPGNGQGQGQGGN